MHWVAAFFFGGEDSDGSNTNFVIRVFDTPMKRVSRFFPPIGKGTTCAWGKNDHGHLLVFAANTPKFRVEFECFPTASVLRKDEFAYVQRVGEDVDMFIFPYGGVVWGPDLSAARVARDAVLREVESSNNNAVVGKKEAALALEESWSVHLTKDEPPREVFDGDLISISRSADPFATKLAFRCVPDLKRVL